MTEGDPMVRVTREASPSHHVRGTVSGMAQARRAIDALQFAGIEANDISLAGEGAAAAARLADSSTNSARSDAPIIWRVAWRGFWWSVWGAIAGVAAGFVFGLSGLTLPGTSNSMALQIVSWGMFLHVGGAIVGVYAAITSGSAWELTFQPVEGPVVIAVRSGDVRHVARAERVLREKGASDVRRDPAPGA
jgi:hypothetical protein